MVKLALRIVPYLSGYSHVQTNTKYSYDTERTVKNARRESLFPALFCLVPSVLLCLAVQIFASPHSLQFCSQKPGQQVSPTPIPKVQIAP